MTPAAPLKVLLGLGISGGLVGSGSLLASGLDGGGVREVYEEIDEAPREYDPKQIVKGYHYHTHYTENIAKGYYEEGLSVLYGKKWVPLLYDHIHETNSQYIYYLKGSSGRKIRITPFKPKKENRGIYAGWQLNLFIWLKEGEKEEHWYGYCYPGVDGKGEDCSDLPNGWSRRPI